MKFLYLYPDVHFWADECHLLFFDTRTQQQIIVRKNDHNKKIFKQLRDIENLYCIPITPDNNDYPLLSEITKKHFGEIVECTTDDRPIAIPPYHVFKQSYKTQQAYSLRVLDYIKEVTIHLGGLCNKTCCNCSIYFKQTAFCVKEKDSLSLRSLNILCKRINNLNNLKKVNIILSSTEDSILSLTDILLFNKVLSVFYISWRNVSEEIITILSAGRPFVLIKILMDISAMTSEEIDYVCKCQHAHSDRIILSVCITQNGDLSNLTNSLKNAIFENVEYHFAFNGLSIDHIRQHYLLNNSDLLGLKADQNRIFGNRELNYDLFGEFIIHPDGTVRLNENTEVIGTIEDDWTDMLNKALNKPNPWLLTRNKIEPCSYCIYRDLCPPIRNLELYMGDKLACVDYYKSLVKPEKDNN